ncbi:MAG: hypothetical protein AAF657_25465 [Acidobacteriota bacterium]
MALPQVSQRTVQADGDRQQIDVVVPSVGANGQPDNLVKATLHRSLGPGRKRLVIVLPIWGSSKYPSNRVIRRLLGGPDRHRTHVLVVHGERALFDWDGMGASRDEAELQASVEETTRRFQNTVMDIRRLITWAESHGDVDAGRIGLVGFSMGALVGSLVMGQDERLAAGVFVMAGAHLHEIFASCRGRPGDARHAVLQRFGWSAETFGRKVESGLAPINPARFGVNIHPSRALFVDASLDHCMPESSREGFWEALGRPERISLTYGHKVAFLSMTPLGFHYTTRRIIEFLDRLLLAETSAPEAGSGGPQTAVASPVR